MRGGAGHLLIRGGRIIDPSQGLDQVGDLLIDEGKIAPLGDGYVSARVKVLNAGGLVLCPGFVDIHCHLREPGFGEKETIASGTRAAAVGGFTAVCCMGNTNPPLDNRGTVEWVKEKARIEGLVHVFPVGCITKGRRGEELTDMAELADAGVVAFSDDGDTPRSSQLMRRALERARELNLPIMDHCQDKTLDGNGVVNEGLASARLGVEGIPAAAEEIVVARDLLLARLTGARVHVSHVSTGCSVEMIRLAREKGVPVTAEVTPHHLTLTEERVMVGNYDTDAKMYPPLRTEDDIKCLIKGLGDGVIDAIATDHAPHTLLDKNCELERAAFGVSGFETALGCLMGLVHGGQISLSMLVSKLTCEPAKIIGKGDVLGSLRVGYPANVTILDTDREWVVDKRTFASKGKNTPFDGCEFRGKVVAAVANGKVVYSDDSLCW